MNKYLKLNSVLATFCIFILFAFTCQALGYESKYSNMLVNVNFEKGDNGLNINLKTIKPYYTKIEPVKKSSMEYVLILPETYNAVDFRPRLSDVRDYVQDVRVELFPYLFSDSNNGYTKITFMAAKLDMPISVNNKVILPNAKLSEKFAKVTSGETKETKIESASNSDFKADYFPKASTNNTEPKKSKTRSKPRVARTVTPKKAFVSRKPTSNKIKVTNKVRKKYRHTNKTSVLPTRSVPKVSNVQQKLKPTKQTPKNKPVLEEKPQADIKKPHILSNNSMPVKTAYKHKKISIKRLLKKIYLPVLAIAVFSIIFVILKALMKLFKKQQTNSPVSVNTINGSIKTKNLDEKEQIANNNVEKIKSPVKKVRRPVYPAYEVIDGFEFYGNKGIYLVKIDKAINLIGVSGDDFIILKQFNYKKSGFKINRKDNNHFIATFGNWKGLIFINDSFLKLINEVNIS